MKRSELMLKDFTKRCLFDETKKGSWNYDEAYAKRLGKTIRAAADTRDFIDTFLTDEANFRYDAYAVMVEKERPYAATNIIRKMIDSRNATLHDTVVLYTESDAGSVKVGTDNFSALISNGYGDGTTEVFVLSSDNPAANVISRVAGNSTMFQGEFNVYSYDCGNEIAATLSGKYYAYTLDKCVAFVKAGI